MKHRISTRSLSIVLIAVTAAYRLALCARYLSGDETRILKNAIHFFASRTIVPTHFNYPTLYSYLAAVPIKINAVILTARGVLPSTNQLYNLHLTDSILPILPARLTGALFGILTVLVLYKIGERCFDRETGLAAAAILGFANIHLFYSAYAFPDATMTFFAACALLFSLRIPEKQSYRDYILAGVFAGLAAATKYNGGFILLALICVHFAGIRDAGTLRSFRYHRYLLLGIAACACAFIAGTPGWIIRPAPFWHALMFERGHMKAGDVYDVGRPYLRQLYGFWSWEKTTALLFALGLIHAAYRRRRKEIVLLIVIAVCFAYIGGLGKKDIHYLLFLFPALSLLAGRFLREAAAALRRRVSAAAGVAFVILALAWPVYNTSSQAAGELREDNRWIAQRWINENIPGRSRIVIDWNYVPKLYGPRFETGGMQLNDGRAGLEDRLRDKRMYVLIPFDHNMSYLISVVAQYLVTSGGCFDRYIYRLAPPRIPRYSSYYRLRDIYSALLFDAESYGWKLLKRFDQGKGHVIVLYERLDTKRPPAGTPPR